MIKYKIYQYSDFEETHSNFFHSLLEQIDKLDVLSPNIEEIIITDDIIGEINRQCSEKNSKTRLTKSREFKAIAKTIDFEGKKKVFFDALHLNLNAKHTTQIFFEQLIEIYAEDIVVGNYKVPQTYSVETPLIEIIKLYFTQWATKIIARTIEKQFQYDKCLFYDNIKIFADSFKRNVRRLHYKHQEDLNLGTFWLRIINELDNFIRRCLDVKLDNGSFKQLQEFNVHIPLLIDELELQTNNLLTKETIEFKLIRKHYLEILRLCFVNIPNENPMTVTITDIPKKLFKGNLVDTEPRIVAFIDILGFSEIVNEYDNDTSSNILNDLHDTLEIAVKVSIENISDSKAKTDLTEYLEYRMFSDCICLSLPYIEFGNDFQIQLQSITTIVKSYQLAMMQKGFFVRGGISVGSFYSDKNMIFSGGLVSAYRLEKATIYPVIGIDKIVFSRLSNKINEYSEGLFIDKSFIYSIEEPEKIFINPYDILDNSASYFDYIQTTLSSILGEDESDRISNTLIEMTSKIRNPIFEFAKSQMSSENIYKAKEEILILIKKQLEKHNSKLKNCSIESDKEEIMRVIEKYDFIHRITEWSMNKLDSKTFQYYDWKE